MEYYERTRYPLVVKLGTITPNGADVFSYAEDEMVEDPRLSEHLAHFGINVASMSKVRFSCVEGPSLPPLSPPLVEHPSLIGRVHDHAHLSGIYWE